MMTVRSFLACPLCGNEMRITSPAWYYTYEDVRIISLGCNECKLTITQFPKYPEEEKNKLKYEILKDRLISRVKEKGVKEVG